MIATHWFWFAFALLIATAIVWIWDVWIEPELPLILRIAISSSVVIALALFTRYVVFFNAQPVMNCTWLRADVPDGTLVEQIPWKSSASELLIDFSNPTDRDFDGLTLTLVTDGSVGHVAYRQTTDIPCSHIEGNKLNVPPGWVQDIDSGPLVFRCPTLPAHSTVQYVLEAVNIEPSRKALTQKEPPREGFIGPKKRPKWVILNASFRVIYRPYFIVRGWKENEIAGEK
jgi:hypothetical protein